MSDHEIRDARGGAEIRAEIWRLRNYNPAVRHVMDTADREGLTAEDRYAGLAYVALLRLQRLEEILVEQRELETRQPIIFPNGTALSVGGV